MEQPPYSAAPGNVRKVIHNYCLLNDVRHRRSSDENVLLGERESLRAMREVHDGICVSHQVGVKI